jgi:membrane-bound lytic murein transglycosylase D
MYLVRSGLLTGLVFAIGLSFNGDAQAALVPAQFEGIILETKNLSSPSKAFPLPSALKPAVAFWQEVFVTYESSDLIVHDKENMQVIWGVYKVPKDDGTRATRKIISDKTDAILEAHVDALTHLGEGNAPRNKWETTLVKALGGKSERLLKNAHQRVRAQRGVGDHFIAGKKRSKPWLGKIRAVLKEKGLPEEIALMTFVESMFNTKAHSSAGAAGIWQIMPRTGRELGLKINKKTDERMDVMKATAAAAKLLKRNYKLLKAWPLAVTGYNHGAYGVKRAIRDVGSRDLVDLIENYKKSTWGFASKNFYAELIAMIRIFEGLGPTEKKTKGKTSQT